MKRSFLYFLLMATPFILVACSDSPHEPERGTVNDSSLNPCYSKFIKIKFEPRLQDLSEDQRHMKHIPTTALTLNGNKISPGLYLRFSKGITSYALPYEDRECEGFHRNLRYGGKDEGLMGDGLVVNSDGVELPGSSDLEMYVENPKGSGNYEFKPRKL